MKKIILFLCIAAVAASCSTSAKLITSATSKNAVAAFKPTVTIADVQVSEQKISFLYIPNKKVISGGYDNIIRTAVHEALLSAGEKYDVLMAKETQVKYTVDGKVESVLVTGYPGCYVNWRSSENLLVEEEVVKEGIVLPVFKKKK